MDYRQKGISLYFQIEEFIANKIQSGEWKPGDKILTEFEMSEKFRVSRSTVRQAILDLVNEGMLVKRQGLGTFVSEAPKRGDYFDLAFWNEFGEKHILKHFSVVKAHHSVSSPLGIHVGAPVTELYRIRCTTDLVPMAVMKSYFSADLFPILKNSNETFEGLLYPMLREKCGLFIHHIKSEIEPVIPTEEERKYLKMDSLNLPTILLTWTCYDAENTPIILTKHILSRDRCKLSVMHNYTY